MKVKSVLGELAVSLLLLSCVEEKSFLHEPGSPIMFGVSSVQDNGPVTRTEYSGDKYTIEGHRYERIDWVKDSDWIRILCKAAEDGPYGDYFISSDPTASGKVSESATIAPLVRYGLHWGTGTHHFYALYPAPGMHSNYAAFTAPVSSGDASIEVSSTDDTKAVVTGVIPSGQEVTFISSVESGKDFNEYKANMNYAYMYARNTVTSGNAGTVTLSFKPLVTTFEFTLLAKENNELASNLTRVVLSSESATPRLSGKFSAELPVTGDPVISPVGTTGSSIQVDLPGEGIRLSTEIPLKITLLTLPFDQTDLTLTLHFANGQHRSLALKDNGSFITVAACKKVYISNLAVPDYRYGLEHTGPTVTLSDGTEAQVVKRVGTSAGSTDTVPFDTYKVRWNGSGKTPVDAYVSDYALADANGDPEMVGGQINWRAWNGSTPPSGLTSVTPAGTDEHWNLSAAVGLYSELGTPVTDYEVITRSERLRENTERYGLAENLDLSLYDIDNLHTPRASGKPRTANCYIVDRAGTYQLPLVFGNAVDWVKNPTTGENTHAYYDGGGSNALDDMHRMHSGALKTVNDNPTRLLYTPYILDDASEVSGTVDAVVVWQDVKSSTYAFITDLSIVNLAVPGFPGKSTVPFLRFRVPLGSIDRTASTDPSECVTGIRQGNAVLAVRKGGQILWSWHIWVTDGHDEDGDAKGDGFTPVPVPLGTSGSQTSGFLPDNLGWCDYNTLNRYRDRVWYVRLRQTVGDADPIVFKVVQVPPVEVTAYKGSNTYYQWGRKDPFLPSDGYTNTDGTGPGSFAGIGKNKEWFSPGGLYDIDDGDAAVQSQVIGDPDGLDKNVDWDLRGHIYFAIQHPHIFYYCLYYDPQKLDENIVYPTYGSRQNWLMGAYPYNLWNQNNGNTEGYDGPVYKTIYDPCPPGYSVPRTKAFKYFESCISGSSLNSSKGELVGAVHAIDEHGIAGDLCYGWNIFLGGRKLFLPMSGIRAGASYMTWLTQVLTVRGDGAYWTAATPGTDKYPGHPGATTDAQKKTEFLARLNRRSYSYFFYFAYTYNVEAYHDSNRSNAFSVRPVREDE